MPLVTVKLALILGVSLLLTGCNLIDPEDPASTPQGPTTTSTQTPGGDSGSGTADSSLSALFSSMIAWAPDKNTFQDERSLREGAFSDGGYDYSCRVEDSSLDKTFIKFPAEAFKPTTPLPGLLIDGKGLLDGEIQVVPLARSSLQLSLNLASTKTIADVPEPTTASLQQAVATLQRDADSRLSGGINLGTGEITYDSAEAHSFEQTSLELGFSLRYSSALASAGLDTAFSETSSHSKSTLLVYMEQPMYTISFVDDTLIEPAQFLNSSVTEEQVKTAIDSGRLREGSPVVYISSVTYGRTLLFTISSEAAKSAQDIEVAVTAAMGSIAGNAEVSTGHKMLLETSEIHMLAIGGDPTNAVAAIKAGDPSAYFTGTGIDTANAAPLSFVVETLSGNTAQIAEAGNFKKHVCTRTEQLKPYSFYFEITEVPGFVDVYLDGKLILPLDAEKGEIQLGSDFPTEEPDVYSSALQGRSTVLMEIFGGFFCDNAQARVQVWVSDTTQPTGWRRLFDEKYAKCATKEFPGTFTFTIDKDAGLVNLDRSDR